VNWQTGGALRSAIHHFLLAVQQKKTLVYCASGERSGPGVSFNEF
jgi:rhodanese-related sulfurtransferase